MLNPASLVSPLSPPAMTQHSATQTSILFSPSNDAPYQRSTVPKPNFIALNVANAAKKTNFIRKKGSGSARLGR